MLDLHKVEPRIFKLIDDGEIDPWDLDLVKLCNCYVEEIRTREDLRISGNALLTAAVLLRLKSKVFDEVPRKDETPKLELAVPDVEIIPVSRKVERKVTVFELIDALKEAFELEKRRVTGKKVRPSIRFYALNISETIEKLLADLPDDVVIQALGSVTLLAMLHLAMKGVIEIDQETWNGTIRVRKMGGGGALHGGQADEKAGAR